MTTTIELDSTAAELEIPRDTDNRLSSASAALPARAWGAREGARRSVILVHGLGAHSGWFEAFGSRLAQTGSYCLAYDQVGFGKRQTEHFSSFHQWLDDLQLAYQYLSNRTPGSPVFLMGNSMGAAVLIKALVSKLVAPTGLVIFSPGFGGYKDTFTLAYRVKALLQALLKPESEVPLPYDLDLVTTTMSAKQWLARDPKMRFSVPARMLLELLKMTIDLPNQCRSVDRPTLMFTAGEDRIVDTDLALKMFERFPATKKKVGIAGAWHDLMFCEDIDEIVGTTADWLQATEALAAQGTVKP